MARARPRIPEGEARVLMSVDLAGIWETWVPVVGQRVTVRLSPECSRCWVRYRLQGIDQATGTVDAVFPPVGYDGCTFAHRFWVRLDAPAPRESPVLGRHLIRRSNHAAIELEPGDAFR